MSKNSKWRTRIKLLRKKRDETQDKFAECLGVDRVTVAKWEQKRNNRTPSRLAQREIERLEKL